MREQPITKLLEFLEAQYGDEFAYFDGDPDEIPKSKLPAIVCVKLSDQISNGPTGLQRVIEQLQVKVLYNKADDWTANLETTDLTEKKIRDLVEARDEVTGGYADHTLKYLLINRFRMEGVALDQGLTFELGVLPRTEELITAEGHLSIQLSYLVPNPTTT